MKTTQFKLRILGIFGILGGLILFAGDMLLYYLPPSTNLLENMGIISDSRIVLSGLSALIAAWFYTLGAGQMYLAFSPAKKTIRNTASIIFAGILIGYGVVHGAYIAIATSAKIATQNQMDLQTTAKLAIDVNLAIRMLIYPLFAILSVIFIWQVWQKKTLYPRWMILFYPLLAFILKDLIINLFSENFRIIIEGGFLNLILVIFFTMSTVSLWNVTD
jgi:hypothetical protein